MNLISRIILLFMARVCKIKLPIGSHLICASFILSFFYKGYFTNYVDKFLAFLFDHLSFSLRVFTLKSWHFWTIYQPLVNVVCERPIMKIYNREHSQMTSDILEIFLTNLNTYPNQILYYISLFIEIRLPTYLKIWRHMWMLP